MRRRYTSSWVLVWVVRVIYSSLWSLELLFCGQQSRVLTLERGMLVASGKNVQTCSKGMNVNLKTYITGK